MTSEPLGIILLSGSHDRAHFAFSLAAAAAALGRPVILFASSQGIRALRTDWRALDDAPHDATLQARGVAGLDTLRAASLELGVRLLACDAALRTEATDQADLLPAAEITGLASFLHAAGAGQIVCI